MVHWVWTCGGGVGGTSVIMQLAAPARRKVSCYFRERKYNCSLGGMTALAQHQE